MITVSPLPDDLNIISDRLDVNMRIEGSDLSIDDSGSQRRRKPVAITK